MYGDDGHVENERADVLNFVNSVETLNVKVERPVAGCRPRNPKYNAENSYILPSGDGESKSKGLALLLNIVEFDDHNDGMNRNRNRRCGSEQDLEYLTDLLIQLNYKLYPATQKERERTHKPRELIENAILKFRDECRKQAPKSIIVFIGSHGIHPSQFYTSDCERMDLYLDVVAHFSHLPELDGKPKIFLLQACQKYQNIGSLATPAYVHQSQQSTIKDVFTCIATMPGEGAMRDFYKGSWFPYCFTYMMMKHALKMRSLQEIMDMVGTMLGQIESYQEFKQVPSKTLLPLYFVGSDYTLSGVRNYHTPSWLQEVLNRKIRMCIVSTMDVQITCDKVLETLPSNYKFSLHEWKDFTEWASGPHSSPEPDEVAVVKAPCTFADIELSLGSLSYVNRERVILVTLEDEQKLMKLNPSSFSVHVRVDHMPYEDLSLAYKFKIKERLANKFGISLEKEVLNGDLLVDIISGRELFDDEIKRRLLNYYVDRSVLTRNIISEKIFKDKNANDIFLVSGISPSELSSFLGVGNTGTGRSGQQLEQVTVRFMVMDDESDFDQICEMTSREAPVPPVHMLSYDKGKRKFRWVRTRGSIRLVQEHVSSHQEDKREDTFLSRIDPASSAPVCISDSPGMGKTILLAQIGKRLRRMFPGRIVLFLELSMFIQRVKDTNIPELSQAIETALLGSVCKTALGKYILTSKLTWDEVAIELLLDGLDEVRFKDIRFTHDILKTIRTSFSWVRMWITSRPHMLKELEATLGGLGYNIKPFQVEDQIHFLTRFWSRDDVKKELDQDRLNDFAKSCLQSLKGKMNSSKQDIAGIPLQCFLIGDVYEKKAKTHAGLGNTAQLSARFQIGSITTLYQAVIKKKNKKYRDTYGARRKSDNDGAIKSWLFSLFGKVTPWTAKSGKLSENKLNDLHASLGISLIFPDEFKKLEKVLNQSELQEVLNVGIYELSSSSGPGFIHRTFAEYFVALFMVKRLRSGKGWGMNLTDFFFNGVLKRKVGTDGDVDSDDDDDTSSDDDSSEDDDADEYYSAHNNDSADDDHDADHSSVHADNDNEAVSSRNEDDDSDDDNREGHTLKPKFAYPVVAYFVNSLLPTFSKVGIPPQVATDINNTAIRSEQNLREILHTCSTSNLYNIFNVLDGIGAFSHHAFELFNKEFMLFLFRKSCVEIIRPAFKHLEHHHSDEYGEDMRSNLLRVAVRRGSYYLVEFLVNRKELRGMVEDSKDGTKSLLHHCLEDTYEKTEDGIDQRIEIVKLLHKINNNLKDQKDKNRSAPLLSRDAHARLVIQLIDLGADIMARDEHDELIIHRISAEDQYISLLEASEKRGNLKEMIHMENSFGETPLHALSRTMDPSMKTLQIFKNAGANFNCKNHHENSLLISAVMARRSVSTVKSLVECGADVHCETEEGCTLLHKAAALGYDGSQILEYLVNEKGLDVNAQTKKGITPLDVILQTRYGYSGNRYFEIGLSLYEMGGRSTASRNDMRSWGIFDEDDDGRMKPVYVDLLLLHQYILGPEEGQITDEHATAPFVLSYSYLKELLLSRAGTYLDYRVKGRFNDILKGTVRRSVGTNLDPIWDAATIQLFQSGELRI